MAALGTYICDRDVAFCNARDVVQHENSVHDPSSNVQERPGLDPGMIRRELRGTEERVGYIVMLDQVPEPPLALGCLCVGLEVLPRVVESRVGWCEERVTPGCRRVEGLYEAYHSGLVSSLVDCLPTIPGN